MKLFYKRFFTRRGIRINERNNSQINYETAIKGTTLDVYFYLLRKKESAGVREVQRSLGLSSPSVSSYHLEKLANLEVIRKNRFGNYEISKKIDIGALNQFVIVRNLTLPRFLFYAVFVSIMFVGYLLFFLTFPLSTGEIFALFFGFFATVVCWIETYLSWQKKPF
ncbi:MAG: winged helix-turn-helix domain-containing protein [Candidatus Hodarchaeales archaeon]